MSKMSKFLDGLKTFGPIVLAVTPLAPIAPAVQAAIAEAESIKDAKGKDKLAHVVAVARASAQAAQAAGVKIDPAAVESAASEVIDAVVAVANIHKAKAA